MIVTFEKKIQNCLNIKFLEENYDGKPPLKIVSFKGPNINKIRDCALATISFILLKDIIGNVLKFENIEVPANIALKFSEYSPDLEFFVYPIRNNEIEILPKLRHRKLIIDAINPLPNDLDIVSIEENELGFIVNYNSNGKWIKDNFYTSLGLFCPLSNIDSNLTIKAIQSCITYELYGTVLINDNQNIFSHSYLKNLLLANGISFFK